MVAATTLTRASSRATVHGYCRTVALYTHCLRIATILAVHMCANDDSYLKLCVRWEVYNEVNHAREHLMTPKDYIAMYHQ